MPEQYGSGGGGGGGGGSGLLGLTYFIPSSLTTYSTAVNTPAPVDATNLTVSFKAPSTGAVLISLQATVRNDVTVTASGLWWAVGPHGGSVNASTWVLAAPATDDAAPLTYPGSVACLLTGLTPGTSYQFDWYFASDNGSPVYMYVGGTPVDVDNGGPAVMAVFAAP